MTEATTKEACRFQSRAVRDGDILVWTVCKNPSDHPTCYTVRAHSVRKEEPCDFLMTAHTLDAIRAKLPPGLTCFQRNPKDDPVIVETWM